MLPRLSLLFAFLVLANTFLISIHQDPKGEWTSTGDPTEVALQVFAMKLGMNRISLASNTPDDASDMSDDGGDTLADDSEKKAYSASMITSSDTRYQILVEFPFSSATKKMSTIYLDRDAPGSAICLTKGAVSLILPYLFKT
jgi:magnesium-transporting ATPase (P-type)